MCGIVAVIGDMGKTERSVLNQLIYADTFRGEDSTGIINIKFDGSQRSYKKAVDGPTFLELKQAQSSMFGLGAIAHNRWATKGKVNSANAHPFTHGDYTGVHNGTLRKQYLLPDSKDFDVDSENIYHSFAKIGVDDTISKLDGAYALVWYNEKEETVSFVRNTERPLAFCLTKDKKHLYMASEAKMLEWILHRNKVDHQAIQECTPHTLYSVDVPASQKAIETIRMKKTTPYVLPSYNVSRLPYKPAEGPLKDFLGKSFEFQVGSKRHSGYGRPYIQLLPVDDITANGKDIEIRVLDQKYFDALEAARKEDKWVKAQLFTTADSAHNPTYIVVVSDTIALFDPDDEEVVQNDEDAPFLLEGFDGKLLTHQEWKEATVHGCSWCSSPAVSEEDNLFIKEDEFICEGCRDMPMVQDFLLN